jgi:DNA-binding MarR family transcriptional regulator
MANRTVAQYCCSVDERYENERLRSRGITLAGLTLLRVLTVRSAIAQTRLADMLHIQPQTVGKTVERLELRGFVRRVRDQDDRRVVLVEITIVGRNLLAALDSEEEEFDRSTGLADQDLRAALENVIVSLRPADSDIDQQKAGSAVSGRGPILAATVR